MYFLKILNVTAHEKFMNMNAMLKVTTGVLKSLNNMQEVLGLDQFSFKCVEKVVLRFFC